MLPSFRLDGKKAIVTGGGRGIGQALAIGMAEAGADVAVVDRTRKDLEKTVQMIEEKGQKGLNLQVDITDHEAVRDVVNRVSSEWGRIDIHKKWDTCFS